MGLSAVIFLNHCPQPLASILVLASALHQDVRHVHEMQFYECESRCFTFSVMLAWHPDCTCRLSVSTCRPLRCGCDRELANSVHVTHFNPGQFNATWPDQSQSWCSLSLDTLDWGESLCKRQSEAIFCEDEKLVWETEHLITVMLISELDVLFTLFPGAKKHKIYQGAYVFRFQIALLLCFISHTHRPSFHCILSFSHSQQKEDLLLGLTSKRMFSSLRKTSPWVIGSLPPSHSQGRANCDPVKPGRAVRHHHRILACRNKPTYQRWGRALEKGGWSVYDDDNIKSDNDNDGSDS